MVYRTNCQQHLRVSISHFLVIMTLFRIATINIHSFIHPKNLKSNAKELALILAPYNLDVLTAQEVINNNDWVLLCKELSLTYTTFGASHGSRYGNAVGSRHPILSYSNQKIVTRSKGGDRAMLRFHLGGEHPFVTNRNFAVTHLDHLDEDERMRQIYGFSPLLYNINILVGDMNALTKDDYSDEYFYEKVIQPRERARWETPKFELTEQLVDTWRYEDALKRMNPALKDENIATCSYGTRIDYIYLRSLPNDDWILAECFIVDTQNATDHYAVLATFKQQSDKFSTHKNARKVHLD